MNVKEIVNNKQFWSAVKPLFSDKTKSNEKITLVEDETVTTHDENKNAELLNLFFSSAVKNLKIPEFSDTDPFAERLSDPTLKAILKCKNHPSIVAIKNANNSSHIDFNEVSVEEVYKKIRTSSPRKSRVLIFLSECVRRTLTLLLIIFADFSMSPYKNLHFHPF